MARWGRRDPPHPVPRAHDRLHPVPAPPGPPYGLAGGAPGALGANRVERADGTVVLLGGSDSVDVGPGDALVIETPGGGGYGSPPNTPVKPSSRRSDR